MKEKSQCNGCQFARSCNIGDPDGTCKLDDLKRAEKKAKEKAELIKLMKSIRF